MAKSTLGRLLSILETSPGAISLQALAQELDIKPERVESMMDFWIQKGKIRYANNLADCSRCSTTGECPFILEMPRTYAMVQNDEEGSSGSLEPGCC